MTASLSTLENTLGYSFQKKELLEAALTHKSSVRDRRQRHHHSQNRSVHSLERLEFLGDRVLGLTITEILYHSYGSEKEGDLAKRLATLVSKESCTKVAKKLGIAKYLRVAANDVTTNSHIIPDALEALLGAIYIDSDFNAVQKVIASLWQELLTQDLTPPRDSKTALQEWAQGKHKTVPEYSLLERTGPDHAPVFHVHVKIKNIGEATGEGITKKEAEQQAAKKLIEILGL